MAAEGSDKSRPDLGQRRVLADPASRRVGKGNRGLSRLRPAREPSSRLAHAHPERAGIPDHLDDPEDPDKIDFRYSEIPRVAQDALHYGMGELVPWFWDESGFTMPFNS